MVPQRDRVIPRCGLDNNSHMHLFSQTLKAKARRYQSPDEYPFSLELPDPVLPPLTYPQLLHPNEINVNPSILSHYVSFVVPRITRRSTLALAASKRAQGIKGDKEVEDDGNYGSAATIDVEVLQSISKRVHYGANIPSASTSHLTLPQVNLSRNRNSEKTPQSSFLTFKVGIEKNSRLSSQNQR